MIELIAHLVIGRQNSAYIHSLSHMDTGASIAEMESETDTISTMTSFNYRRRIRQCRTASEHWVVRGMACSVCATFSTRLALFIDGITSVKKTCELGLAGGTYWRSSTQLVICIC